MWALRLLVIWRFAFWWFRPVLWLGSVALVFALFVVLLWLLWIVDLWLVGYFVCLWWCAGCWGFA